MTHIAEIIKQVKKEGSTYPIPSFFGNLDKIFSGFSEGEFTLIAGDKNAGSTSLMLSIIHNILKNTDYSIGIISLDLSVKNIIERISKNLDKEKELEWLKKQSLYFDSPAIVYIQELYEKCLEITAKYGLKALFIDSFKSLDMRGVYYEDAEQKQVINEQIAKELKKIARLLNIPIIVTATLERSVEERTGEKRPTREDIPAGLDIYPDNLLLLYRPEIYGIIEDEEGNPNKNIVDVTKFITDVYQDESVQLKFDSDLQKLSEF